MNEGKQGYLVEKRSGQIPAFGNWDYADDLPITQYFECARQGGLFRCSNSSNSGECAADIYAVNYFQKKPPQKQKTRSSVSNKGFPHVEDQKKNQVKKKIKHVGDAAEPPKKQLHQLLEHSNNIARQRQLLQTRKSTATPTVVRAVDEDLYKIPPDLLHTCKRKQKRRLGFFSRCLLPDCMV